MTRFFALLAAVTTPTTTAPPVVSVPVTGAFVRTGAAIDGAAWERLPPVRATAPDHDGKSHAYDGVRLADALRDAGSPVGDALRGPAARAYLLVSASDGYSAVFSLGELDTGEARCAPLLVDRQDGAALPADVGTVRVVAPCDRTHARWVRGVTRLTVIVAADLAFVRLCETFGRRRPAVRPLAAFAIRVGATVLRPGMAGASALFSGT